MKEDNIALSKLAGRRQIFAKICRLCEDKDGPFLNIFDSGPGLSKRIEELMSITIGELDDLPHKICFRCSAKVSDLHEFVEKCKATQRSLSLKLGKKVAEINKKKAISSWEAKLKDKKLSNDELCDELVKKALESVAKEGYVRNIKLPVFLPKAQQVEKLPAEPETPQEELSTETNKEPQEKPVVHAELVKPVEEKPIITIKNANINLYRVDHPVFCLVANENGNYLLKDFKIPQKKINLTKLKNALPRYINSLKVSGLGNVFNCSLCKYVFVDKQKASKHKCDEAKSSAPSTSKKASFHPRSPPASIPTPSTSINAKPSASSSNTAATYKPGPASRRKVILNNSKSYLTIKKDLSEPPPIDLTADDNEKLPPASASPATPLSQTQSCFLVPIGNNSFELRLSNVPPPNSLNGSNFNFSSMMSPQVSTQNNPYVPQSYPPPHISPPTPAPAPAPSAVPGPSTLGYRPQISKMSIKNTPFDNVRTSSKKSPVELQNFKEDNSSPKKLKRGRPPKTVQKPIETPGPYPVGLLYRSNADVGEMKAESESTVNIVDNSCTNKTNKGTPAATPQYKVIPSKGSTKLVISSVASKGNVVFETSPENKSNRKRNSNSGMETVKVESPPEAVTHAAEAPKNQNSNYFTYVNIDPMVKSTGYVLPTKSVVQEPQISTTIKPLTYIKQETSQMQLPHKKRKPNHTCSICDLEFSNEKKMIAHIRTHYEGFDDNHTWD